MREPLVHLVRITKGNVDSISQIGDIGRVTGAFGFFNVALRLLQSNSVAVNLLLPFRNLFAES